MPLLQERQSIELSFEDVSLPRNGNEKNPSQITSVNFLHQRSAFSLTVMTPLISSKLYRSERRTSFGGNARSCEALLGSSHDKH